MVKLMQAALASLEQIKRHAAAFLTLSRFTVRKRAD